MTYKCASKSSEIILAETEHFSPVLGERVIIQISLSVTRDVNLVLPLFYFHMEMSAGDDIEKF